MDAPDLQEIRALLRTQPALIEARSAPKLVGGLKRILRRGSPTPAPAEAESRAKKSTASAPVVFEAPAFASPPLFEPSTLTLDLPLDLTQAEAPRRARFGLASGPREPEAPSAPEPPLLLTPDPAAPIVIPRRRREEGGAIGTQEIMELHELLAERMPALLKKVDLPAKVAPGPLAEAEPEAAPEPAPAPVLDPEAAGPRWRERAICFIRRRSQAVGEHGVLSDLYAQLSTEHGRLQARLADADVPMDAIEPERRTAA